MKKNILSTEEQQILSDIENGKYSSVSDVQEEIKKMNIYARNAFSKTKNINIRLTVRDIQKLKVRAAENNLPYQTLISTILRQYTKGLFTLVI